MKHLILLLFVLTFASSGYTQDVSDVVQEGVTITEQGLQQTDEILSTILSKSLTVATATGEFVMEQAPDLLRQFYIWHLAESLISISIGLLIIVCCYYLPLFWGEAVSEHDATRSVHSQRFDHTRKKRGMYYTLDGEIFANLTFGAGLVVFSIIFFANLHTVLFIILAPKLYLIEYFVK
jgi:hypothetical protein